MKYTCNNVTCSDPDPANEFGSLSPLMAMVGTRLYSHLAAHMNVTMRTYRSGSYDYLSIDITGRDTNPGLQQATVQYLINHTLCDGYRMIYHNKIYSFVFAYCWDRDDDTISSA